MPQHASPFPIRPGMDVYSAYQDQYIGSVVKVWRREPASRSQAIDTGSPGQRGASPRSSGTSGEATQNPQLEHEEGSTVSPTRHIGSRMLGEEMGPFPTIAAGNTGPVQQSAGHSYATGGHPGGTRLEGIEYFAVRPGSPGHVNPLARPLYIPASAVYSLSMDRIVLGVQREQMPEEWRRPPLNDVC